MTILCLFVALVSGFEFYNTKWPSYALTPDTFSISSKVLATLTQLQPNAPFGFRCPDDVLNVTGTPDFNWPWSVVSNISYAQSRTTLQCWRPYVKLFSYTNLASVRRFVYFSTCRADGGNQSQAKFSAVVDRYNSFTTPTPLLTLLRGNFSALEQYNDYCRGSVRCQVSTAIFSFASSLKCCFVVR